MTGIPLRLIDPPAGTPVAEWRVPGNMWRDREGWAVVLPNGRVWYSGTLSADGGRWTVTGEAPSLTVMPSIDDQNLRNPWHGWIRAGELVDA